MQRLVRECREAFILTFVDFGSGVAVRGECARKTYNRKRKVSLQFNIKSNCTATKGKNCI